ncbi:MAG: hypothetical protein E6G56_00725 [Actinobacteria bacterium]|nr:MAG: hypothetical protein E6G56_00725 [Actinomycetota bacterium]
MKKLGLCLVVLGVAAVGGTLPAAQAHYDSAAHQLCAAERIQLGPHGFAHRYGGHGAMWRCVHSHSSAHQAGRDG